ncbi:hypothetical protein CTAYLR_010114 [Chrysophaeum taylorii]|uniref:BEACH domain-containing protein n=1 Tax=Chrysophaeum taylorii TaxID=2483200 RepID=A0AAD7UJJ2_9STRA|nr:hypothetical protein CTAYLR_010114 [Chrysophaeum taylorii]
MGDDDDDGPPLPFGIRCVLWDQTRREVGVGFLEEVDEAASMGSSDESTTAGQLADDGDEMTRRVVIVKSGRLGSVYRGFVVGESELHAGRFGLRGLFEARCASYAPVVGARAGYAAHPRRFGTLRRIARARPGLLDSKVVAALCGGRAGAIDLQLRFWCFQLFKAVEFAHDRGLSFSSLSSASVLVTDRLWLEVLPCFGTARPSPPPGSNVPVLTRWLDGRISNFEYLVLLNSAAGRGAASSDHAVLPWVSDFSEENGGWRDLTKTKFRLTKGDAMLDRSYATSKHHVSEPALSELALCIYLARRAPLSTLRRVVRAHFVAEQYPASMRRLYEWSPDECVPEFFCDPTVFASLHKSRGLGDLAVPAWCATASDFVAYHRRLLESDYVSSRLHSWIDLVFGYACAGPEAKPAKNVPLADRRSGVYDRLLCSGAGSSSSSSAAGTTTATRRKRALEAYLMLEPASSRGVDPPPPPLDERASAKRADFDSRAIDLATAREAEAAFGSFFEEEEDEEEPTRRDIRPAGIAGGAADDDDRPARLSAAARRTSGATTSFRRPAAAAARSRRTGQDVSPRAGAARDGTDPAPSEPSRCWSKRSSSSKVRGHLVCDQHPVGTSRRGIASKYLAPGDHLFPDFFGQTYEAISELKAAQTRRKRVLALLDSLPTLAALSLAGNILVLPHVLECLDDGAGAWGDDHNRSAALELARVVSALGPKLGAKLTARALLPREVVVTTAWAHAASSPDVPPKTRARSCAPDPREIGSGAGRALWRAAARATARPPRLPSPRRGASAHRPAPRRASRIGQPDLRGYAPRRGATSVRAAGWRPAGQLRHRSPQPRAADAASRRSPPVALSAVGSRPPTVRNTRSGGDGGSPTKPSQTLSDAPTTARRGLLFRGTPNGQNRDVQRNTHARWGVRRAAARFRVATPAYAPSAIPPSVNRGGSMQWHAHLGSPDPVSHRLALAGLPAGSRHSFLATASPRC